MIFSHIYMNFNIILYIYLIISGSTDSTSDPLIEPMTQYLGQVDYWFEFYNYGFNYIQHDHKGQILL